MPKISHFSRIFRLSSTLHKCYEPQNGDSPEISENTIDPKKILLAVIGIALAIGLFYLTYNFSSLISLFGGASVLLPTVFFIGGVSVAFLALMELVTTLYMSSDLPALIVLPYSPLEIVCARLIGCLRTVIPASLLIIIPACLGFGIGASLDPFYYLVTLLGAILVPLFSLLAVTSVIILLMSFLKIFRNKDTISVIGILFAVAIIIFSSTMNSSDAELGETIIKNLGNIANFSKIIPVAPLLSDFYTTGNFLFLLAVLGILALTVAIFVILTRTLYLKGALNIHSGRTGKKNFSIENTTKKSGSAERALWKKELRTVFRTPAFYVNGWIMSFIWPIIFIIPIISSLSDVDFLNNILSALGSSDMDLSVITPYALSGAYIISLVFSVFSSMFCNLPFTAISREGSSFFFMRTIPVSISTQLKEKLRVALFVCLIGSTPLVLTLGIGASIIGLLPFYGVVPMLLVNLSVVYLMNTFQLYLGAKKPNLSWTNIAAIGKASSLFFIILSFVIIFVLPGASVLGLMYLPPIFVFLFYLILIPVVCLILGRFLIKKSVEKIESLI